jgi:hypothetical protein
VVTPTSSTSARVSRRAAPPAPCLRRGHGQLARAPVATPPRPRERSAPGNASGGLLAAEEDLHTALSLVSESLTRAWRTLTPSEETVLRAIRNLPEPLQKNGFRRRDLQVPGVSDRRIKEVLKSLTDTGYLDCDDRAGPQGYSYTVAREVEEVSLGISLRPVPDREESRLGKGDTSGRDASARYRPMPVSNKEPWSGIRVVS